MNYIDKVDRRIREYFNILEPYFPEWLNDYINTEVMLKQQYIGIMCGVNYSNLFDIKQFYSNLDHSIGTALIMWHFTHSKKQTLSGLFHDIATPTFKHCIDFLNDDYMNQESTEELTSKVIFESKEIMSLLKRDNIKLEEVDNYHIYPIADNNIPRLCADRLEYTLSNSLLTYGFINIDDVKEIYNDLFIIKNEDNLDEISFKTKKIARKFVKVSSKLLVLFREDRTRYSNQFIADIIKKLIEEKEIKLEDLYNLKESDVLNIIEKSQYKDVFNIWKDAKKVKISKTIPSDVYYIHHGAKIRYIDPLVENVRISKICKIASKMIERNKIFDMTNYVYLDGIKFK